VALSFCLKWCEFPEHQTHPRSNASAEHTQARVLGIPAPLYSGLFILGLPSCLPSSLPSVQSTVCEEGKLQHHKPSKATTWKPLRSQAMASDGERKEADTGILVTFLGHWGYFLIQTICPAKVFRGRWLRPGCPSCYLSALSGTMFITMAPPWHVHVEGGMGMGARPEEPKISHNKVQLSCLGPPEQ
jgi:hypothetical protein